MNFISVLATYSNCPYAPIGHTADKKSHSIEWLFYKQIKLILLYLGSLQQLVSQQFRLDYPDNSV